MLRGCGAAGAVGQRVAQIPELGLPAQEGKALLLGELLRRELVTHSSEFLEDSVTGEGKAHTPTLAPEGVTRRAKLPG